MRQIGVERQLVYAYSAHGAPPVDKPDDYVGWSTAPRDWLYVRLVYTFVIRCQRGQKCQRSLKQG